MKNYYFVILLFLFSFSLGYAQTQDSLSIEEQQRREENIQAGNPFKKFGYKPKISTLSKGKYLEFHDRDSIVQIGSFTFHVKKKVITGYIVKETKYSEATLRPEIVSRWFSPDPLSDEFPSWSPYTFTNDNPIFFIDPTGLAPETIYRNLATNEEVEVKDNIDKTIEVSDSEFQKAKSYADRINPIENSDGTTTIQVVDSYTASSYNEFYDSVNSYSSFSLANVKDNLFNRPQLFTLDALGGAGALEAISGPVAKVSSISFKSFTQGNYRHNLKALTNSLGIGQDAHHIFPQAKRFQKQFKRAGLNIHNPVNLRWWEKSAHRSASKAYNRAWDGFFTRNPNATGNEIKAFGRSIAKDYSI